MAPEPTQDALEELERILQEKLAQENEEKLRQQKVVTNLVLSFTLEMFYSIDSTKIVS